MGLMDNLCFAAARWMLRHRRPGGVGARPETLEAEAYRGWRMAEHEKLLLRHFDPRRLAGKDVLDFGCGTGEMAYLACQSGARSVCGVDLLPAAIAHARHGADRRPLPVAPTFLAAADGKSIPLPPASVDLVLCIDVLEHVMDIEAILGEWHRILRAGGEVFIWWSPWLAPYGHHIESLVPLPWAHVLFSDRTLIRTCRRVYDLPEFQPRIWDLDSGGQKKPNKWLNLDRLPEVNRLTIHRFENLCRIAGFEIAARRPAGFSGSRLGRLTHPLLHVPFLREFVTSYVTYELRRPGP